MTVVAFFRQLERPLLLFHLLPILVLWVFLAAVSGSQPNAELLHTSHRTFLLLAPAMYAGFIAGIAWLQVMACGFSWTVPGLRRQFATAVILAGLVVSTLAACRSTAAPTPPSESRPASRSR